MGKKHFMTIAAALFLGAGLLSAQRPGEQVKRDEVPMPTVHQDTLMKHVMELSSETYRGRLAGTEGYNRAVRYVKSVLQRYGLEQIEEMPFAVECNEVENAKFNVYRLGDKERSVYSLGNEFCCAGVTGRGYVDAQMVFCGYGVDDKNFDEYKYVDVKGKVAIVLTGLPEGHGLPEAVASHYITLRDKARTAEKHGAIGMLAVNVSPSCPSYEVQAKTWCGELPHLGTFPILQLTLDCAREIMADQAIPLDSAMMRIERYGTVQSYSLLKKAEIDVNARYNPMARTTNVMGLLRGSDKHLSREYVVIGASLDGSGMQGETCLCPGADINASGVAAVLETARLLSKADYRPRRSVLFVIFSGSEQQYAGSRAFVERYPQLDRAEAFVNVQNIGYGDSVDVLGGFKYPTLESLVLDRDTVAGRMNVVRGGEPKGLRGDARALDAAKVPSVVITTTRGMHHNHTTTDVWENIDRRIITICSQLVTETVAELGEGLYQGRNRNWMRRDK
ncbi:MAG: M28 family peptidase [Bacteroidales bacterium]|nr:M28 family peptidase [Bacteroidales bacterium]